MSWVFLVIVSQLEMPKTPLLGSIQRASQLALIDVEEQWLCSESLLVDFSPYL